MQQQQFDTDNPTQLQVLTLSHYTTLVTLFTTTSPLPEQQGGHEGSDTAKFLDRRSLEFGRPVRPALLSGQAVLCFSLQQQQLTMQAAARALGRVGLPYGHLTQLPHLKSQVVIQPCSSGVGIHLSHTALQHLFAWEAMLFSVCCCFAIIAAGKLSEKKSKEKKMK